MTDANLAAGVSQWATRSGSVWARRWRDTDAGLAGLAPYLLAAVKESAPGAVRAFEIGCGPGSTALEVAAALPDAEIVACDVSSELAGIARQRAVDLPHVRVVEGDAEVVARSEGPFDLFFSRHGTMFFDDPVQAFGSFRSAATTGASLVFSCFQSWESNPWASALACAVADRELPAPGREQSGFAFADPAYVRDIFAASGWVESDLHDVRFNYVAGQGADAVDHALGFFSELGPSARLLESLSKQERSDALDRMRTLIEQHHDGGRVSFPAAAWIWSAKAGA